ncbi:hypothetical protein J2S17_004059 [Cytobacillus purgationiresistens]|uniref:Uncharacterized protein n=1 Tax=Cytobacillus purgationiresistens TaxID=863449 RepID=A0ABU0AMZ6_9BACI|nr:hypothetical protein [Cytobacillus purgationiresistens]
MGGVEKSSQFFKISNSLLDYLVNKYILNLVFSVTDRISPISNWNWPLRGTLAPIKYAHKSYSLSDGKGTIISSLASRYVSDIKVINSSAPLVIITLLEDSDFCYSIVLFRSVAFSIRITVKTNHAFLDSLYDSR